MENTSPRVVETTKSGASKSPMNISSSSDAYPPGGSGTSPSPRASSSPAVSPSGGGAWNARTASPFCGAKDTAATAPASKPSNHATSLSFWS
jgi:hypothetical protein